jgi:hypothetical protein
MARATSQERPFVAAVLLIGELLTQVTQNLEYGGVCGISSLP